MSTPETLTVQANGLEHNIRRWPSDGPPLLVVHGITNSARGWDFVCRRLQPRFACYAVDLRGHGLSGKPEHGYNRADYATDLAGIVEALGLAPLRVMGHSLGSAAVARMAADRPELVSRLVLVDPATDRRYPAQEMDAMNGFLANVRATRERGEAAVREQYPHWDDEQVAARVEGHRQMSDRVMLDRIERYDPGTIFDDLPRIGCPTLFVYADASHKGPRPGIVPHEAAERARAALKQGQLAFVPNTGHMIPWDDLEGFLRPVTEFLTAG